MPSIANINVATFKRFLISLGLSYISTKGGHEKWKKKGMLRPIIFQTHIDPIPVDVIMNNLRTLGVNKKDLLETIDKLR